MVAVRIFGLPWRVEVDEIAAKFGEYGFVPNSIILGKAEDGRNNGLGSLLFKT